MLPLNGVGDDSSGKLEYRNSLLWPRALFCNRIEADVPEREITGSERNDDNLINS